MVVEFVLGIASVHAVGRVTVTLPTNGIDRPRGLVDASSKNEQSFLRSEEQGPEYYCRKER